MVYDTEDPTLIAKMNHEMREIESMEIVGVLSYTAAGQYPAGFGVTLRCRASKDEGACGKTVSYTHLTLPTILLV